MKRDLRALAEGVADVIVVGAGIYGAMIAREAALRGLDVRLVERDDFGAATSANSHHIIHGGIRYLQHGDVPRVLESIRERHALTAIAPHLVQPLPVVIPTYGHGLRGRELMTAAIVLHRSLERLSGHQARLVLPDFPPGPISRARVRELLPGVAETGLTGGVLLYDSQVENSERLLLAIVRSAVEAGARVANYVEVEGLRRDGARVAGVLARDRRTDERLEIRGRNVVNAAGPWIGEWLERVGLPGGPPLARALNLVVRELFPRVAAGLYGSRPHREAGQVVSRGQRLYFFAPWRGRTIVGTSYAPHRGDPSESVVRRSDVEDLLGEINHAYPPARLGLGDVALVHTGLLPAGGRTAVGGEPEIRRHFEIRDHAADRADGLFSVVGVKYTTARDVAKRVVDRLYPVRGEGTRRSVSAATPLPGADVGGDVEAFRRRELDRAPAELDRPGLERVLRNHGSSYGEVLRHLEPAGEDAPAVAMLRAEVRHAVRDEMALTLADVFFRRTDLGSAGRPATEVLETVARIAAAELGWSAERTASELAAVERRYQIAD